MKINEFNALNLRYGSLVKVEMKPLKELKSLGIYPVGSEDKPRAGYLLHLHEHRYGVGLAISSLPDGNGGSIVASISDIKNIIIFERAKEGELAQIALSKDKKSVCIFKETKSLTLPIEDHGPFGPHPWKKGGQGPQDSPGPHPFRKY